MSIVVQKIEKGYGSSLEVAIKYFKILLVLNNIHLKPKELQLLAYTAIKGNISSGGAKEGFIKEFNSSKASIGNMIGTLYKEKLLIKEGGRIRVQPFLVLDFNNQIVLQLTLNGAGS